MSPNSPILPFFDGFHLKFLPTRNGTFHFTAYPTVHSPLPN